MEDTSPFLPTHTQHTPTQDSNPDVRRCWHVQRGTTARSGYVCRCWCLWRWPQLLSRTSACPAGLLGLVCCPPTHWRPRPEPCLIRPWTQRAPKACPGSFSVVDGDWAAVVPCSGHGSCAGRPGRPVCREGDTCDVACVCDAGYGGAGCGSTTNQTAAARQVSSLTKAQPLAAVLVE